MRAYLPGFLLGLVLTAPVTMLAQTAPQVAPDAAVAWDQPGPSLAAVRTYRYTAVIDGGSSRVITPTCQASTPPASGFTCAVVNPAPAPGSHTMSLTYAIPLSDGTFTGESPAGTCAWDTIGNPTAPPSNFRWGRILNGIFAALKAIWRVFT